MEKHAEGIVHLFDSILQMLGPDVEFIEDILSQVGSRHAKMGVNVSLFPFLGNAWVWAIQQDIGAELSNEHVEAWEEVYDAISGEIVKAILNASVSEWFVKCRHGCAHTVWLGKSNVAAVHATITTQVFI